jgi:hypothetical protein
MAKTHPGSQEVQFGVDDSLIAQAIDEDKAALRKIYDSFGSPIY